MKKIMIFALAIGLSVGAFAQVKVKDASTLTAKKAKVNATMVKDATLYPESFNSCATIDSATILMNGSLLYMVSGTNAYGDKGFAQRYSLSAPVTVKGISGMLAKYDLIETPVDFTVTLNEASEDDGIGNELASVTVSSENLNDLVADNALNFGLETYTLPSTHTVSNFAVTFNTPMFTYSTNIDTTVTPNDTTVTFYTNMGVVATTSANCASGSMSYSNSTTDGTTFSWITIADAWSSGGSSLDLDMMLFPIVEGSGLSSADVNTLSYVYPNPASDNVTIASSLTMNRVELFNMIGQRVYSAEVSGNTTNVNTANLSKGTYAVKIFTTNGVANKKLVIE